MKNTINCIPLMSFIFAAVAMAGGSGAPAPDFSVDGVTGLAPVDSTTYFALHFEFPNTMALSGFLWYNNDEEVEFPRIFLTSGDVFGPGVIDGAFSVLEDVGGESLDWSEVFFDSPIGSNEGGLYLVFELDSDSGYSALGTGGGFGIGYRDGSSGSRGWYSNDGETWIGLNPGFRYAVQANLVDVEPGMVLLSAGRPENAIEQVVITEEDAPPENLTEMGVVAAPNPFNPKVRLWYHVPERAEVDVQIFDVRGRLVQAFHLGDKAQGSHFVTWQGDNLSGAKVASGVYMVNYRIGNASHQRRVTLLK